MSPYDAIAAIYDGLWSSPEALAENTQVIQALNYTGGRALDIGCGSGLFLDYVTPDSYVGIDPSREMLATLRAKHSAAHVIQTRFEDFWPADRDRFDVIVGLFGSPAYVSPDGLARVPYLLTPGGRYFLMLFNPDYVPETQAVDHLN